MGLSNFSITDIVSRIVLVLPSKFDIADGTDVYAFWCGIAAALKMNTDQIDTLIQATNLGLASGAYVDDFITSVADLGRHTNESDLAYKTRYYNNIWTYNCTQLGIQQVVVDINGTAPIAMFASNKRGAYYNARYYYNDAQYRSEYGDQTVTPYVAYIELAARPSSDVFDYLCQTISVVKAAGVRIYLKYPPS